jgi:hypothetical protein
MAPGRRPCPLGTVASAGEDLNDGTLKRRASPKVGPMKGPAGRQRRTVLRVRPTLPQLNWSTTIGLLSMLSGGWRWCWECCCWARKSPGRLHSVCRPPQGPSMSRTSSRRRANSQMPLLRPGSRRLLPGPHDSQAIGSARPVKQTRAGHPPQGMRWPARASRRASSTKSLTGGA